MVDSNGYELFYLKTEPKCYVHLTEMGRIQANTPTFEAC